MNSLRLFAVPMFAGLCALAHTARAEDADADPRTDARVAAPPPGEDSTAPRALKIGDFSIEPSAALRLRGEYRGEPAELGGRNFLGQDVPRIRNAGGILERARLGLVASKSGGWKLAMTLQDARIWGTPEVSTAGAPASSGGFGLFEAYVERRGEGERASFLRVGRQRVQWGEGRLLGEADFSPTGRSLDAVRAQWTRRKFELEALGAVLDSPRPSGVQGADAGAIPRLGTGLFGLRAALHLHPLLHVEGSALARVSRSAGAGDGSLFGQSRRNGWLGTGDVRVYGERRGYRYEIEGAYQIGEPSAVGRDARAFMLAGSVSKEWARATWAPKLRIGASYASGDKKGESYTQFDPLLADVAVFEGPLQLVGLSNSLLARAELTVHPHEDLSVFVAYRYARLANAAGPWVNAASQVVGESATNSSAELGHTFDFRAQYQPDPAFAFSLAYSGMLYGDGARNILQAQGRGRLLQDATFDPAPMTHLVFLEATARWP